jgi:mRNA interferase RelE/StbE
MFTKDLSKFKDPRVLKKIKDIIEIMENVSNFNDIDNLKKIQGHATYYRIRVGDYRLGLKIESEQITLMRFLHRREIYRYFP